MKEFNLEEYLKNPSRKVVTREGQSVKIHCTNYIGEHPIIAQVEGYDYSASFCKDGRSVIGEETPRDLFFAPEKHEGYVSIYRGVKNDDYFTVGIFDSEEKAKERGGSIATVKVEWED